jgi:NAD(P)-dependent dehydrogenase (short-subunit alcohol dehydrogenase family)
MTSSRCPRPRALADAGHTAYAGMRDPAGTDAPAVAKLNTYAREHAVNLHPIAMDLTDEPMVNAAIKQVIDETGRLDVVVHAGHMVLGPAEAFTAEQFAQAHAVNVLSTQRVNRAALPHLRAQRDGLLMWVGSRSARGGPPSLPRALLRR